MQRIVKYGGIQNTSLTPDKELCHYIKKLYTFKNGPVFWHTMYIYFALFTLVDEWQATCVTTKDAEFSSLQIRQQKEHSIVTSSDY